MKKKFLKTSDNNILVTFPSWYVNIFNKKARTIDDKIIILDEAD